MNHPVDAPPPQDNLPADVQQALAGHAEARQRFNALPPSHQREYLKWINEAKRESTRQRRVAGMIERLLATAPGQKGPR